METQAGPDDDTAETLAQLLQTIETEHDQEHPEKHSGCHTQVLLAGVRAAASVCDDAARTGAPAATAALRRAIGEAMRTARATSPGR